MKDLFDEKIRAEINVMCRDVFIYFGYAYDEKLNPKGEYNLGELTEDEKKRLNRYKVLNE